MQFADLHCHPHFWTYIGARTDKNTAPNINYEATGTNWQSSQGNCPDPKYTIWNSEVLREKIKKMAEADMGGPYAQSDLPKLVEGNCQLVFASLYPMERGWVMKNPNNATSGPSWLNEFNLKAFFQAPGSVLNGLSRMVRILLNRSMMYMPSTNTILLWRSTQYDYYKEFIREYKFIEAWNNKMLTFKKHSPGAITPNVSKYTIATSAEDLDSVKKFADHSLVFVLNFEGMHILSMGFTNNRKLEYLGVNVVLDRIRTLKDKTQVKYPFFYVSYAHHFDNGLCGHAQSLPDLLAGRESLPNVLVDQRKRCNTGFSDPKNEDATSKRLENIQVIAELLDLDYETDASVAKVSWKSRLRKGRRILIDVKHMSAMSRLDYYNLVVRPANASSEVRKEDKIPVIASHVGYTGFATLWDLVGMADQEDDNDVREFPCNPLTGKSGNYSLNSWGINLCEEDLQVIYESQGLIGISMDQRVLGRKFSALSTPLESRKEAFNRWFYNLMAMVEALDRYVESRHSGLLENKRAIWDLFCVGSDFDGFIDPIDHFSTAAHFNQFEGTLKTSFQLMPNKRLLFELTEDELLEKVAWRNAYNFTAKHFPRCNP